MLIDKFLYENEILYFDNNKFFLFTFASQGSPTGGPIDESGPEVLSFEPQNNIIGTREPIEIIFNEYIDQSSVGSSIFINNS